MKQGELAALRRVETAARNMPRVTPAAGAAGTIHRFALSAAAVWALDAALTELDRVRGKKKESVMPSLITPDTTGDVKITWDPTNPDDVKNAKDHFDKLKKSGHIFFKIAADGEKGKKVKEFDENIGELVCEFDPKADVVATKVPVGG